MPTENNDKQEQTQEPKKERDLASELDRVTEHKEPTNNNAVFWGLDDPNKKETTLGEDDANTEQETSTGGKLSKQVIEADAKASAAFIELLTSNVAEGIIGVRYHLKFKSAERKALDEFILDTPDEKLTEPQLLLKNRKKRLDLAKKENLKTVSASESSRSRMENAFAECAKLTGKTYMTPKTMLNASIAEAFIKAITGAFID